MKTTLLSLVAALGLAGCGDSRPVLPPEDATSRDVGVEAKLDLGVDADEKPKSYSQCGEYGLGAQDACILMEWFGSFEGPFDKRFYDRTLPLILQNYGRDLCLELEYKHFNLFFFYNSGKAAEASECAQNQDRFWDYHGILFEKQEEWERDSNVNVDEAVALFKQYALELKLDTSLFNDCLDSGSMASRVDADYQEGLKRDVNGVPTFFINDQLVVGAQPYSVFEEVINTELKNCPP